MGAQAFASKEEEVVSTVSAGAHPDFNFKGADVTLKSSDDVLFPVVSVMLSHASEVFAEMLTGSPSQANPSSAAAQHRSLSIINLPEPAEEVSAGLKLGLGLPIDRRKNVSFQWLADGSRFCEKYKMVGGLSHVRMMCPSWLQTENLPGLMSLALRMEWDEIYDAGYKMVLAVPDPLGWTSMHAEKMSHDCFRVTTGRLLKRRTETRRLLGELSESCKKHDHMRRHVWFELAASRLESDMSGQSLSTFIREGNSDQYLAAGCNRLAWSNDLDCPLSQKQLPLQIASLLEKLSSY